MDEERGKSGEDSRSEMIEDLLCCPKEFKTFSYRKLDARQRSEMMMLYFRKILVGIMKNKLLGFRALGSETIVSILINCCHSWDLKRQGLKFEAQY